MFNVITQDFKKTFSKYEVVIKKIPFILANHVFLFILGFIILGLALGGFLFYYYIAFPKAQQIEFMSAPAVFQETTYQSVLSEWEKRQTMIDNFQQEKYNNPF